LAASAVHKSKTVHGKPAESLRVSVSSDASCIKLT